jgi:hypothetical protein
MTTYYVNIPGHDELSAEVDAPDKRHARTVYLDHLSRNRLIPYSQRGTYRKLVKLDKMQPGEVATSIKLRYGDGASIPAPVPEQVVEELPQQVSQQEVQSEVVSPYPPQSNYTPEVKVESQPLSTIFGPREVRTKPTTANSPIMNLSKSSGGR